MLMSRCGLDTTEHFDREDFEGIINFNTLQAALTTITLTQAV